MISIDEMQEMLSELLDELPEPFFAELNGGVSLLPEAKPNPAARADDLYILGEYHSGGFLGRAVFLYYGSFERVFGITSNRSPVRTGSSWRTSGSSKNTSGRTPRAARPVKPPGRRMKTVFAKVCGFAVSHFNIPANGQ